MNTLFYHAGTERWYHPEKEYWLGNTKVQKGSPANSYPFFVQQHGSKLGPLVGILTSGSPEGRVYGDWKRFVSLQLQLQKRGGISVVFTPYGVNNTYIEGYVLLTNKRWRKCQIPYPDVVYNRIPYRTHETSAVCQQALIPLQNQDIPLFNPGFFSKWDVHQAFQENALLHKHLLPTELLHSKEAFIRMLTTYPAIYVKHTDSSKGKHLLRVKRSDGQLKLTPVHGKTILMTEEEAWQYMKQSKHPFLAQPSLPHDEHNGRKYDLRMLVHFYSNSFHITGIGVRVAETDGIVTHVPNGGEIIPINQLARPLQYDVLHKLAEECGNSLCTAFGRVREFSLDIGVDQYGDYYIFEANAKPMMFDEPSIQTQALRNLVTVFEQEAGFFSSIS